MVTETMPSIFRQDSLDDLDSIHPYPENPVHPVKKNKQQLRDHENL